MGKYSRTQETTEKMRAARTRVPVLPDEKLPKGYDDNAAFAKAINEAEGKVGPVFMDFIATVQKCEIEYAERDSDDQLTDEDSMDIWKLYLIWPETDPKNPGYMHVEWWRTRPDAPDGGQDTMTRMSLDRVDNLVLAAIAGNYELDDAGDYDYDTTFAKKLTGCEVAFRMKIGTRLDKKAKIWRKDIEVTEFHEVE